MEPKDGYPVLLADWIRRDGLTCLKVKLRGDGREMGLRADAPGGGHRVSLGGDEPDGRLQLDGHPDPAYVCDILDRLKQEHPAIFDALLYVEQPFPYELERNRIDVHEVSRRRPLFLDESAHDWRMVRLGRELGWTGVALKTCKTQTGALLSAAWARAHGMQLMVQDLTNPMLAQIPHCLLGCTGRDDHGRGDERVAVLSRSQPPEAVVHPAIRN